MSKDNNITRRSVLKTVGLTGLTASTISGITTTVTAQGAEDHVPKGLAKKAARKQVLAASQRPEFSEWKGANVGHPTMYKRKNAAKGPAYLPSSYVFPVITSSQSAGYVTVAARRDEGPILEYSKAQPPNERIDSAVYTGRKVGKTATDTPLYHGGVKYGLAFEDGTAMNLRNGRIQPIGDGIPPSSLTNDSEMTTRQWETIQNTPSSTVDGLIATTTPDADNSLHAMSPTADHIWGVPAWTEHDQGDNGRGVSCIGPCSDSWNDWDGCVPIAASMIIAYHEGISESNDYKREALIDKLHITMQTSDAGSTIPSDIDDGFDSYDSGSKSYNGRNIYVWGHPDFMRSEVSKHRPFLLNMTSGDSANDRSDPYGNHTVTVVGYCCNGASFRIHDTWDDTDHYLNWGSWLACSYTAVYPS